MRAEVHHAVRDAGPRHAPKPPVWTARGMPAAGGSFETFLVENGLLDAHALARIQQEARHLGAPFLAHAVAQGHLGEEQAYRALAAFHGLPFLTDFGRDPAVVESAALIAEVAEARWVELDLPGGRRVVVAAPDDARHTTTRHLAPERARAKLIEAIATPAALRRAIRPKVAVRAVEAAVLGLAARFPQMSARRRLSSRQAAVLAALAIGLGAGAAVSPFATALAVFGVTAVIFAAVTFLRLALLAAGLAPPAQPSAAADMPDRDLPVYTILVPLYREAHMVGELAQALWALDYPRARLDIKLILEADDRATREAVRRLALPSVFETVIVPAARPRTKPKALAYALQFARGSFVCVFDAEDLPAPTQLREALAAFRAGGDELACVQARLAAYNVNDGWLSRQFAIEYAALFQVILPACERLGIPLLLGGTSNHFRIDALRAVGGWDPYNVTEDADLGLRLARHGLRAALIDSVTLEEAPSTLGNWFSQRLRWLRGWMQTYLVHMRAPAAFARDIGFGRFVALQAMLAGVLISALVHPFFIAHLVGAAVWGGWFEADGTPFNATLLAISALNLLAGYGVVAEIAVLGLYRTGRSSLLPAIALLPFYWLLISLAAYGAIWRLATRPHRWEKTRHRPRQRRRVPALKRAQEAT